MDTDTAEARDPAADARNPTVLIAEDEDGVRALLVVLLRRAGFEVIPTTTGREALEVVEERGGDVDAALLDVMMPDMNGPEALPAMRGASPGLPVVFVSGFGHDEVAEHLGDPSAYTSFLAKPFENVALVEEVQRAGDSR